MHPCCSLLALAVALALVGAARATDHPITGDSLVLKDPMAESDRKVRFKATHDAAIDPSQASTRTSRSEEHTSELQSHSDLVCRLLLEKKKLQQRYKMSYKVLSF